MIKMQLKYKILKQCEDAKLASIRLASAKTNIKNKALIEMAGAIRKNKDKILAANKKDIENAEKTNLSQSLLKRLKLDNVKINEIIAGVKSVAKLEDPVGKTLSITELDKGLVLHKVTVPIGVIGAIFESRPDALVQIASLCLKSGNAVILKGGSEAENSSKALFGIIKSVSEKYLPKGCIQLISTREEVKEILKMDKFISLLVPRGSNKFVKYIQENTKIPVLGHSEGICHVYIDKDADLKMAMDISFDAKCQYPAVCNAMETLLVHKAIAKRFLPLMEKKFKEADVELRGCPETQKILKNIKEAAEEDWKTEYSDLILSVKTVKDIDEAIAHINKYGSGHTDAIVTKNKKTADKFLTLVDSSSVMVNCSTRFSDGFRYGFGAEVGISTNKIHARGPVGLEGLVIYKYKLFGKGHIVAEYTGKKAKKFVHRVIKDDR